MVDKPFSLENEEGNSIITTAQRINKLRSELLRLEGNYRLAEGNLKLAQAEMSDLQSEQTEQVTLVYNKYGINLHNFWINPQTFELTPKRVVNELPHTHEKPDESLTEELTGEASA